MSSNDSLIERSHIVASLVVSSPSQDSGGAVENVDSAARTSRVLVQLAKVGDDSSDASGTGPSWRLGVATFGNPIWYDVGHLDLDAQVAERVLLAGLSACAMAHVREAEVQLGDPVLVLGADPWSFLLLQWARLQGASPLVYATPRTATFSEQAAMLGVDAHLLDPSPGDLARAVTLTHRGAGFAMAIDAMATERSMTQALSALRDGGRYMLAGITPQQSVSLNAYPDLHRRDLEVVSATHAPQGTDFASMFRFGLRLADAGRLRLDGLLDPASGWQVSTTR